MPRPRVKLLPSGPGAGPGPIKHLSTLSVPRWPLESCWERRDLSDGALTWAALA